MENKKGSGIFLGIVSIATLVVAIIGATFAYFSATTQSDEDAVQAGAYEFKLTLSVSPVWSVGSELIPLIPTTTIEGATAPNNTNLLYAVNAATNRCVDSQGLQVCVLYKVTIENRAANTMTLNGQIKTTTNEAGTTIEGATGFTNLTYQGLEGEHNSNNELVDGSLTLLGDPVTLAADAAGSVGIQDITIPGATGSGDDLKPGVGIAYVLLYLNDTGGDQSAEMGSKFTGQLIYSSSEDSGNTLTGTFTIGQ